jgi:hypothetical protein
MRTFRKVLLVFLLVFAAALAAFSYRYRGFMRAGMHYGLHTSLHERMNVIFMLRYWVEFVGRMAPDADRYYTFDTSPAESSFTAALLQYHKANFAGAVAAIEKEIAEKGENETRLFWLGMSQLRRGEAENCLPGVLHAAHTGTEHAQYCALPIRKFHEKKEYSRAAAKTFLKLIEGYGRANRLYHWLLNYASMTTDDFPAAVPAEYRVSQAFSDKFYGEGRRAAESRFAHLRFEERAGEFGVNTHNAGRGVAVEDYDHDGFLDIITGGSFEDLRYYHNRGGTTYEDWTERAGLGGRRQPFFISVTDIDNDGWADILVTHMFHDGFELYRNNGNGTFTDVTRASGLMDKRPENAMCSGWAPSWADVDNDGDLDLFVPTMGMDIPFANGLLARPRMRSALYINDKGHFTDQTAAYGLADVVYDRYFTGSAFGDLDGDGYPDLFLSSPIVNDSFLLMNKSGKRFEVSQAITRRDGGFSTAFLDVNQDGLLDLFQGGFSDARSSVEMAMFGEPESDYRSGKSAVMIQQPDGRLVEQTGFFDTPGGTMGASFGDVNNDGCYDFYLGTGSPEGWFIFPKLMYLGVPQGTGCAGRTEHLSMTNSFASVQKGHGIVFFDFDGDGLQDMYSSLGGMWPADRWPNQFFVNRSKADNAWVKIRLRGRKSNSFGVGAQVKVTARNARGEALIRYAHMDQKTAFGSGPYLMQMGLADATSLAGAEVFWPASGCRQSYPVKLRELNVLDEAACGGGGK